MVKVLQLNVEVGTCRLPNKLLPHSQYILSVELSKELTAATSIKAPQLGIIYFGTRLFVKLGQTATDKIPTCLVILYGVNSHGDRSRVASGEFLAKSQGCQEFRLFSEDDANGEYVVELQFGQSYVQARQSKSKNNRSISSKSNLSQKQSSSDEKQKIFKKNGANFNSMGSLEKYDSKESLQIFTQPHKINVQEHKKSNNKEQLETSAATSKPETKIHQPSSKSEETTSLLTLQIKIDKLQENLSQVTSKLADCNSKLERTVNDLESQRTKNKKLELCNEQLVELLTIEELRAKIANDHAAKMTKIVEELAKGDKANFDQIQQKDEIIMLNEELENELTSKQDTIDSLKAQIVTLKDKVAGLQIKLTPVVSVEVSSIKKLQNIPSRQLQKVKSQKKITDRKGIYNNKKADDITKETNGSSKQQVNKNKQVNNNNKIKKEVKVPVRSKPSTNRNELPHTKIPKGGKQVQQKQQKHEQKAIIQQKKSNIEKVQISLQHQLDALHQPTNLMLVSRTIQSQKQQSN